MCRPGHSRGRQRARTVALVGVLVALAAAGCGSDEQVTGAQETTVTQDDDVSPSTTPADPEPSGQPDVTPAPAVLTQDDDGSRVSLAVGDEVALRLDGAWSWEDPTVDSDGVVLAPVNYFDDPGFVEWVVTGASPGTTTLRVRGEPACGDPTACPAQELVIEVVTG